MPCARPRVYISCPITLGDREANIRNADAAARALVDAGYAPFNPALSCFSVACDDLTHETWIDIDLPWVEASDVVLRLPGESVGADQETDYASTCNVPVVHHLDTLTLPTPGAGAPRYYKNHSNGFHYRWSALGLHIQHPSSDRWLLRGISYHDCLLELLLVVGEEALRQ